MQACTPPRNLSGLSSRMIAILIGVVVLAGLITTIVVQTNKEIKILVDDKKIELSVFGGTVSEALNKAAIKLGDKDVVAPGLTTKLEEGMKIVVTRAIDVNIIADGETTEVRTPLRTVSQVLKAGAIELGPLDKVDPQLDEEVKPGDSIKVIRVTEKTVLENKTMAFKVEKKADATLYKGITHTLREGKQGTIQRTMKVTLEDGKEVKRELVGEKVIKEPVSKLVAIGSLREKTVSRGGKINFDKVIVMSASGYTYTGNNTASGVPPRPGVAAVDPRVIPLGTRLYIEGYGYAKALDVGSAIKGNKIDLFFASESQALRWGRRPVKVYILK